MKTTAAEDLALDTFLTRWDYEERFSTNLDYVWERNKEKIGVRESFEEMDWHDLAYEIIHLSNNIQKLIYKELERNKLSD